MSPMTRRLLVPALATVALLTGACSRSDRAPDVAAVVEGTDIPAAQTEALLEGQLKTEFAAAGSEVDGDRRQTIAHFVLLYQIKHALLRHLAAGMHIAVTAGPGTDVTPEAEAGRLSQAMAERLFPGVADEERRSMFLDWFDKQLRSARVRVDGYFGRWDARRGVVQ